MNRRTLLGRGGALALAGLAGCAGSGGGRTETETPTERPTRIVDHSFGRAENCDGEGATVTVEGDTVVVRGCVQGRNGCAQLVGGDPTYDPATGVLRVSTGVEYVGEVCTMALVQLAYEHRVSVAGSLPDRVEVVEKGETVATARL